MDGGWGSVNLGIPVVFVGFRHLPFSLVRLYCLAFVISSSFVNSLKKPFLVDSVGLSEASSSGLWSRVTCMCVWLDLNSGV